MATYSPYIPSGMNADAITINPALIQNTDSTAIVLGSGRHGEQLVSEVHGKRYVSAARGNLWHGSSGTGGVSLLAAGGTTGGFVLYNSDTQKLIEVHKVRLSAATTITDVIAGLGIEGSKQVPTGTLTGTLTTPSPLATIGVAAGSSTSVGKVYGACTISAMTFLGSLGLNVTATTFGPQIAEIDFDGSLVLGPGYAINLVSSITQSTGIMWATFIWSEWLP